jgi:hypothetical protein
MHCRVCGSEKKVEYRNRSRMFLCERCHATTPEKATYEEFLEVTKMEPGRIAQEFYSDYRTSTHGPVQEYWDACTVEEAA